MSKSEQTPTVLDVALFFMDSCFNDKRTPYNINHLQLHGLCYYALGWHFAFFHSPLFKDTVEAWKYGPVFPQLYETYERYEMDVIPPRLNQNHLFSEKQRRFLQSVWRIYGKCDTIELMERTRNEEPWLTTYDTKKRATMTKESIAHYFIQQKEKAKARKIHG